MNGVRLDVLSVSQRDLAKVPVPPEHTLADLFPASAFIIHNSAKQKDERTRPVADLIINLSVWQSVGVRSCT